MSPGLRLLLAPAALLVGALVVFALPSRRRTVARVLTGLAIGLCGGLLLSVAGLVMPHGRVERSLGDLVPGVALLARADPAGLAVALLACGVAVAALAEWRRTPVERCALLVCLAGTVVAALAGNAVLLFGGMEIGNAGALLLAVAGSARPPARMRVLWLVQHGAALGLLTAAVELQNGYQTSDLVALPAGALATAVAAPWTLAALTRLLAPLALPSTPGRRESPAWAAVAAAPTGLLVLLREVQLGGDQFPRGLGVLMMAAGCLTAVGGATQAMRCRRSPTAAGRALAVAATGPVMALVGVNTTAALTAAAAAGLALVLALAAAPAWGAGGEQGSGRWSLRLRAAALVVAGGLPLGFGTTALLLCADAAATRGLPLATLAIVLGGAAVVAAAASVAAARVALAAAPPVARSAPRLDAALPLVTTLVAAILPGVALDAFAVPVGTAGGSAPVGAIDAGAIRGPGGGWAGGYLTLATLVVLAAAWAASALQPAPRLLPEATASAGGSPVGARGLARVARRGRRVLGLADRGLAVADRWLVTQPGLALVIAGAVACLYIFR